MNRILVVTLLNLCAVSCTYKTVYSSAEDLANKSQAATPSERIIVNDATPTECPTGADGHDGQDGQDAPTPQFSPHFLKT